MNTRHVMQILWQSFLLSNLLDKTLAYSFQEECLAKEEHQQLQPNLKQPQVVLKAQLLEARHTSCSDAILPFCFLLLLLIN